MVGEVVDTKQVFAAVWLSPTSARGVKVDQVAHVGEAGSKAEDRIAGKVAYIGKVADAQTGNLPVHVLVENTEGRLTLGESTRVSITLAEAPSVLMVPALAVVDKGEGVELNVVRDGKAVALHPKEVGRPHEGWVAVTGTDLKAGEPVIVEGGYNLPDGTPVNVAEPEKEKEKEKPDDKKAVAATESSR